MLEVKPRQEEYAIGGERVGAVEGPDAVSCIQTTSLGRLLIGVGVIRYEVMGA